MQIPRWRLGLVLAAFTALVAGTTRLSAQGVTTGAISGIITGDQGQPVEAVNVQVLNRSTGARAATISRSDGRYYVQGLEVGGPYTVSIRRIGFAPQERNNITVSLGQNIRLDFTLTAQATQLSGVVVSAETQDVTISPSHVGAATQITDSALRRLPSLNRNFTDFVALTPQISTTLTNGGLSGGGVNNRFNNVTIDGITEADVFGLGATGQPGGQANGKSIGIESVKEYQVLLSPYDVRQGNFAGVLINAVTKSGTNDFHGSIIGNTRNQQFVRSQPYITDFNQSQYGVAVGGPIVRNRAFFFVNPEFQRRTQPASGPYLGQSGVNLSAASVDSFTNVLTSQYNYTSTDIGTAAPVNNKNPLQNVFARLDFNLPGNTQLVLRHNYGRAENDIFSRSTSAFQLSENGYTFQSTKNSPAAQVRTLFSNGSYNEFLVGLTSIRDRRTPHTRAPQVTAFAGNFGLTAGAERFSQGNELDQDIFEVTDNFSLSFGSHRLVLGTQNQFMKFRNLFAQASYGAWQFGSIDSLRLGLPNTYVIGSPVQGDGAVRLKSRMHAGYVGDEWAFNNRLTIQLGVRADMPVFPDLPPSNPQVLQYYGVNTGDFPSGNLQWSPRVGFNLDATGDGQNQFRGGAGLFTGRPAYVWLANSFQNSGLSGVAVLTCTNSATLRTTPQFTTANIQTPPTSCTNGRTAALGSEVDVTTSDFRFPQNFRGNLAYDRRLTNNWIVTVEGIYTKAVNAIFYRNIALAAVRDPSRLRGKSAAEAGRWIYGVGANGGGSGTPDTVVGGRTQIFEASNQSRDYSYNLTGGLQRRYADNFEGSLFYTYSRSFDVQNFTSSTAFSQYRFGRAWGYDQNSTELGRSAFEQRHRIVAYGTYSFPTKTDISVQYFGESGASFYYTVNGDPNADGVTQNDPIFIPKNALDANEVSWAATRTYGGVAYTGTQMAQAFENYVQNVPCVREQRGKLMARNSCDNPFTHTVNVLVRQSFKTLGYQNVTFEFGVFNFLNLLNQNWGVQPSTGGGSLTLLDMTGITGGSLVAGRPVYAFNPTWQRFLRNNLQSNYQMQAQLRYSF
jgi:hypothetical protein